MILLKRREICSVAGRTVLIGEKPLNIPESAIMRFNAGGAGWNGLMEDRCCRMAE